MAQIEYTQICAEFGEFESAKICAGLICGISEKLYLY